MSQVIIYHNPRCSKSRKTLALLQKQGIEPEIIEYLKMPPSADELRRLLKLLKLQPRQLMRTNEVEYKDNQLANTSLTEDQLIQAMIAHPELIQRPIIVHQNKATIGRPPEKVLEILYS